MLGLSSRKLSLYSQASVTKKSFSPTWKLPPISSRLPPTETVGFFPAFIRIREIIAVVVVLPWVPDMAMLLSYSSIRAPRACALVTVSQKDRSLRYLCSGSSYIPINLSSTSSPVSISDIILSYLPYYCPIILLLNEIKLRCIIHPLSKTA